MRAILVAGSPEAKQPKGVVPGANDLVIAVDSGALHARMWGWPIHLLVGDLDSLPVAAAEAERKRGTQIYQAPVAKDETDLELGLVRALDAGADEIIICGALGGRTDHLLANLLLLCRSDLAWVSVRIIDGGQRISLLRARGGSTGVAVLHVDGVAGDLLSLLPVGGDAVGVTTNGLTYPLRDETLYMGQARGVSNQLSGPRASVTLREGVLMVMYTAAESPDVPG